MSLQIVEQSLLLGSIEVAELFQLRNAHARALCTNLSSHSLHMANWIAEWAPLTGPGCRRSG